MAVSVVGGLVLLGVGQAIAVQAEALADQHDATCTSGESDEMVALQKSGQRQTAKKQTCSHGTTGCRVTKGTACPAACGRWFIRDEGLICNNIDIKPEPWSDVPSCPDGTTTSASHAPEALVTTSASHAQEALVPEKEDPTGCKGGSKFLHGDWNASKGNRSSAQVHITTFYPGRNCTLHGDGHKYIFGWPYAKSDNSKGAEQVMARHSYRIFPICHSVDKKTWKSNPPCGRHGKKFDNCHVLINGGSNCNAEQVIGKLNAVKWEVYV